MMTSFAPIVEDEEIERVLRAAGIESAPIDPSSMDALRQLVREHHADKENGRKPAAKPSPPVAGPVAGPVAAPVPVPVPVVASMGSSTSNYTDAIVAVDKSSSRLERNPSDLTQPEATSGSKNVVLDQLEFQTTLLLEMQKKIDQLTAKVDRLEQSRGEEPSDSYVYSRRNKYYREPEALPSPAQQHPRAIVPPPPSQQQQQQQPPFAVDPIEEEGEAEENRLMILILAPYRSIRDSRIFEITRMFWVMSGNHVRPLDGALLFKVMFMLLVFTARVKKQRSQARFYVSIVVMVLGFLWHTRYLQFTYQFFWQDNVPGRIWNGLPAEGPPHLPVPPNRRQPPQQHAPAAEGGEGAQPLENNAINGNGNNNNNNNINNDWTHTFLGGAIAGRADNPAFAFAQDIAYLFGSFIFSIFPMWRPEGPPPLPAEQEEPPLVPEQQQQQQGGGMAAIPQVQPPADAMEAADSDVE